MKTKVILFQADSKWFTVRCDGPAVGSKSYATEKEARDHAKKNRWAVRRATDCDRSDDVSAAAAAMGRKGGSAKSPAKTAAARKNAKKPRPRKTLISADGNWKMTYIGKDKPRPYGCKCETLTNKLTGDGCDECNPEMAEEIRRDNESRKDKP
jgi:hypothetical protein